MRFTEAPLAGVWLVDIEPVEDGRGFFARAWCEREFRERGLDARIVQCNLSYNGARGTLRGLHYQRVPHQETKLVRCVRGSVFDVVVDLRRDSATRLQWYGVELSAHNRRALYVPAGFAHGFQTLEPDTELFYQMSTFYHPEAAAGLRWDDPALAISWPLPDPVVSPRDLALPLVSDA